MRDVREPLAFAAFVLAAYVVARFVGVAVHEVLGHFVTSFLMGGSAYAFYASPGSGFTYVFMPQESPLAAIVAVQLSGVAVEFALAAALWGRVVRTSSVPLRILGLLLLEVLTVQALLYMGIGAFDFLPGDTRATVAALGRPSLALGFLVVGLAWTVALGWVISVEVGRTVGGRNLRRRLGAVILFWIAPVPLSFIPGFAAWEVVPVLSPTYAVLLAAAIAGLGYVVWWTAGPRKSWAVPWERRRVVAVGIATLAVLPLWLGAFGATPDSAVGVLVSEPPVEAERGWVSTIGINLLVTIGSDLNVTMEFRMRGLPELTSPLQRRIWSSFDDRMDRPFWEAQAQRMAADASNVSPWIAQDASIGGTVWALGEDHPHARVVRLVPDPARRSDLLRNESGLLLLTIRDPFQPGPPAAASGFLDEITIRWEAPLALDHVRSLGGTSLPTFGAASLRWRSLDVDEAPARVDVYLQVA